MICSSTERENEGGPPRNAAARSRRAALTLLEMMVAITLLAAMMVGLFAMFHYTERTLHAARTQTDVFDNARAAIQLLARDLAEMTAFNSTNVINAYGFSVPSPISGSTLPLPSGATQPVDFEATFWLTRVNDDWRGVGYYVEGTNFGVGTLYRFSETAGLSLAPSLLNRFAASGDAHRVCDGIVHFRLDAVYPVFVGDPNPGITHWRANNFLFPIVTNAPSNPPWAYQLRTIGCKLPEFVDLEIGVLEPATLKQFNALTNNPAVAQKFLRDHAGRIHFFRERVSIHNFVSPLSNEL